MSTSSRPVSSPRLTGFPWVELLRAVLVVDALVLLALGLVLALVPARALEVFHFEGLPAGVLYMVSLLGAVFLSLSLGYAIAATAPLRHVVWVQVGILRGALEVALSLLALGRGWVTWEQARFGLGVAAMLVVAYLVVYPRRAALGSGASPTS